MLFRERNLSELAAEQLKTRLSEFYGRSTDYTAFAEVSSQSRCWEHIALEIRERLPLAQKVSVLEVGAGRSGFADWLAELGLRNRVLVAAQDVTNQNAKWLSEHFDCVYISGIDQIPVDRQFDIVFSTYVLEHVTNPRGHLNCLYELLKVSGKLFVFCPRYDFPGYLPPSTRHLRPLARFRLGLFALGQRARTLFTGEPAFLVQTDLSIFHKPFFTDADACHWVSIFDLRFWAKRKGARLSTITLRGGTGVKNAIVIRYLTCGAVIHKLIGSESLTISDALVRSRAD
jgi:SAM-dependent methyltransferase